MKATEILKDDHKNVLDLINRLKALKQRNAILLQRIYDNLKVHTQCETQIFYPALDGIEHDEVQTCIEEHQEFDDVLEELMAIRIQKGMAVFMEVLDTLDRKVRAHFQEEEERLMPAAEEGIPERLDDLGRQIEDLKADLRTSQYGMAA